MRLPEIGTVVSAGRMNGTVRVLFRSQTFDTRVHKYFGAKKTVAVADPHNSVVEGDVVRVVATGLPVSKTVKHIVTEIVAPFGVPIEDRTRLMSLEEWIAAREAKVAAKRARRAERAGTTQQQQLQHAEPVVGKIRRRVLENKRKAIERYQKAIATNTNAQDVQSIAAELKRMGITKEEAQKPQVDKS